MVTWKKCKTFLKHFFPDEDIKNIVHSHWPRPTRMLRTVRRRLQSVYRWWMGPPVTFEVQYTPLRIDLSQCEWSVRSVEWGYTLRIWLRLPGVKLRNHSLHFQRHSNFDSTQSSSYSFMLSKYLLQFGQILECCLLWFLHLLQDDNLVKSFLDRTLTSRLGIRMLAEHHLALHDEKVSWTLSCTLCLRLERYTCSHKTGFLAFTCVEDWEFHTWSVACSPHAIDTRYWQI